MFLFNKNGQASKKVTSSDFPCTYCGRKKSIVTMVKPPNRQLIGIVPTKRVRKLLYLDKMFHNALIAAFIVLAIVALSEASLGRLGGKWKFEYVCCFSFMSAVH